MQASVLCEFDQLAKYRDIVCRLFYKHHNIGILFKDKNFTWKTASALYLSRATGAFCGHKMTNDFRVSPILREEDTE